MFVQVPINSVIATSVGWRGDSVLFEGLLVAASLLDVSVACALPSHREASSAVAKSAGLGAGPPGSAIYHCVNLGELFSLFTLYCLHL